MHYYILGRVLYQDRFCSHERIVGVGSRGASEQGDGVISCKGEVFRLPAPWNLKAIPLGTEGLLMGEEPLYK